MTVRCFARRLGVIAVLGMLWIGLATPQRTTNLGMHGSGDLRAC